MDEMDAQGILKQLHWAYQDVMQKPAYTVCVMCDDRFRDLKARLRNTHHDTASNPFESLPNAFFGLRIETSRTTEGAKILADRLRAEGESVILLT